MTVHDGPAPVPEGAAPVPDGAAAVDGRGHLARHGRALAGVLVVSGIGLVSTAVFQLVVIRGLGPAGYGLLASFLALINVASVGSAALRNSVAVAAAEERVSRPAAATRARRLDGSAIEAIVLGALCTAGVVLAALLLGAGDASATAIVFVALTVGPYFLFARAQGLLQGVGRARAVVLWTTGVQVAQLGLSLGVLAAGWGAVGVLSVLLTVSVLGALGATVQARRQGLAAGSRAFTTGSLVVLALTIAFTWLTSIDVVLVRSQVEADVAGAYAAAATVIKTVLIVPATLSLYLLPRFVSRRDDASMTRLGVLVTLGLTLVGALGMVVVVLVLGDVVAAVFGSGYELTADLLPALALAWVPWAMAQGMLIRLTAASSRAGVVLLVVLAGVQWFGGSAVLPDVERFIAFNGGVGAATLVAFLAVHAALVRRQRRAAPAGHAD